MSWYGLSDYDFIKDNDIANAISVGALGSGGSGVPSSNNSWLTKSQILACTNVSSISSSRGSNDWCLKTDLYTDYAIYGASLDSTSHTGYDTLQGYSSCSLGLSHSSPWSGMYARVAGNSFGNGTTFFLYYDGTSDYHPMNTGVWYYNNTTGYVFQVTAESTYTDSNGFTVWRYTVTNYQSSCVTYYTGILNGGGSSYSTCNAARNASTGGPTVYLNVNTLTVGPTYIYTDSGLTTPFNTGSNWYGIFFNGTKYGIQTNSSGQLISVSSSC